MAHHQAHAACDVVAVGQEVVHRLVASALHVHGHPPQQILRVAERDPALLNRLLKQRQDGVLLCGPFEHEPQLGGELVERLPLARRRDEIHGVVGPPAPGVQGDGVQAGVGRKHA